MVAGIYASFQLLTGPSTEVVDGQYAYPGYEIVALEPFEIEARVLSRRDYRTGRESDLSLTDLALGWGPMARDDTLEYIEISQSNRWYHWRASALPIPRRDIESHSANMHMIAANPDVANKLSDVPTDARVHISGQLVEVRAPDGWKWRSSLTRHDTGDGACEVVWVESLRWSEV